MNINEFARTLSEKTGFRVNYFGETFIDFNIYIPYIEKRTTLTVIVDKNVVCARISFGSMSPTIDAFKLMNKLTALYIPKFYIDDNDKLVGFAQCNMFDFSEDSICKLANGLKFLAGTFDAGEEYASAYRSLVYMLR